MQSSSEEFYKSRIFELENQCSRLEKLKNAVLPSLPGDEPFCIRVTIDVLTLVRGIADGLKLNYEYGYDAIHNDTYIRIDNIDMHVLLKAHEK